MKIFTIRETVTHGWELFKQHARVLVLSTLILLVLSFLQDVIQKPHTTPNALQIVLRIIVWIVTIAVQIGWFKMILKIEDGQPTSVNELTAHVKLFFRYLAAAFLLGLMIVACGFAAVLITSALPAMLVVATVIAILVGAYLFVRYSFVSFIAVDKVDLSIMEVFRLSQRLTKGVVLRLLGLLLICFLIEVLGALAFGVGLLVTVPVAILALAHAYRTREKGLTGVEGRV